MNSLPGLQGNPHADALKLHQDHGNSLSPTVQATLALAFEQRTANLIAYAAHLGQTSNHSAVKLLEDEVDARLGLTEES